MSGVTFQYHDSDAYRSFIHAEKVLWAMQDVRSGEKGAFGEQFNPIGGIFLRSVRWMNVGFATRLAEGAVTLWQGAIDCSTQVQNINQVRDEIISCIRQNLKFLQEHPELKEEIEGNLDQLKELTIAASQGGLKMLAQSFSDPTEQERIQTASKEFQDRITYPLLKPKMDPHAAAMILQKFTRRQRIERNYLPKDCYQKYAAWIDTLFPDDTFVPSRYVPKATNAQNDVYFPEELPDLVIKDLRSSEKAIRRWHEMRDVRDVVEAQGSFHLKIPRADVYGRFLIEEYLPIDSDISYHMSLYMENPSLFDDAVRELTRLCSKFHIPDLLNVGHPRAWIRHQGEPVYDFRSDNLSPFLVQTPDGKKKGMLSLHDLENVVKVDDRLHRPSVNDLVRIYPYHLEIIKEEAKMLKIPYDEKSLQDWSEKGKTYLQVGYVDHFRWLKSKGISLATAASPFSVRPERMIALTQVIEEELIKLNEGINDYLKRIRRPQGYEVEKGFLKENQAKELAPLMCQQIVKDLKEQLEEKVKKLARKFAPESDMVTMRSPVFLRFDLYCGLIGILHEQAPFSTPYSEAYNFPCEQLLRVIMQELVNGGELFYWDPDGDPRFDSCWVRW